MYTYNWYQWLAFFYIYCFFGWIFESVYVSLKKRHFVNRGFLRIPMLPLYGFGAVMMLWVSLPVRDNLLLVYLFGVIAATALEYVTGYVMERLFKVRYWDYSNQKFQLHGYICLTSSIAWGFLTILMTEVIHEPISAAVLRLNPSVLLFCVITSSAVFAADVYESTKEALALGKSLEAITRIKEEMDELQARITALKEEAAEQVFLAKEAQTERLTAAIESTTELLSAAKEETAERLTAVMEDTEQRLAAAKAETQSLLARAKLNAADRLTAVKDQTARMRGEELANLFELMERAKERAASLKLPEHGRLHRFYRKGLLKGNPGAVSSKFAEAFRELREQMEHSDSDMYGE